MNREQIKLLTPRDVPAQLSAFRSMEDGWLEGSGIAPSLAGLDWLAATFTHHCPPDIPLPTTAPTAEGGIWMEWAQRKDVFILEIDLDTHLAEWLWFDRAADLEQERELNLDLAADWKWLFAEIRNKADDEV